MSRAFDFKSPFLNEFDVNKLMLQVEYTVDGFTFLTKIIQEMCWMITNEFVELLILFK